VTAHSLIETPNHPGADAFHRERSKCVDAFAAAEMEIIKLLRASGAKIGAEPFKQKIMLIQKVAAGPAYSKARKKATDQLAAELETLLALRADIVHARMQFAQIDGAALACFMNAREAGDTAPVARLMTYEALRSLGKRVIEIANQRGRSQVNPASSPPPPSQAVAIGP